VNCPGLSIGGGVLIAEKSSSEAVAKWIKVGGASGGSGDPAIQLGSGSALSSTTGWSIRRDISDADVLKFLWNNSVVGGISTTGGAIAPGLSLGPTRTIAAGVITIGEFGWYRVATEGGAATDDLDTINGGLYAGQVLVLASATIAQNVVLKDNTGNLRIAGDFSLNHSQDRIQLMWDGQFWCELSRADNS
jgi:hypothetical protein